MTTSLLMAKVNIKDTLKALNQILCIHYPLRFQKKDAEIKALIHSSNEINAMTLLYTSKLGLKICFINVRAQKINGSIFKIFKMVLVNF